MSLCLSKFYGLACDSLSRDFKLTKLEALVKINDLMSGYLVFYKQRTENGSWYSEWVDVFGGIPQVPF